MNRVELVNSITEKTGVTKKVAEDVLAATLSSIEVALSTGDKVQLVGFGTFEVKNRAERVGRNPQNPTQSITIPASKVPVFKAGKALKEAVNK